MWPKWTIVARTGGMLIVFASAVALCAAAETGRSKFSPNEALAGLAKEVLLQSLPAEYEKRDNWGHQTETTVGYHWVRRDGGWHLDKRKKKVNDGLWRLVKVKFVDPERNLHVRLTPPEPAADGRTKFQAILNAKLWTEARQERWRSGVKGLNIHIEAEAHVEVRLDIEIGMTTVADSWGTIEIQPEVTDVGLRLVDLRVRRISKIGGDVAKELGNATEDILNGELRKREEEVRKKINAEIEKNREKLRFSPAQIAEIGWDKIRMLLGADGEDEKAKK